ncbi:MAG: ribonuclease HII [Candidatus Moraniibacteriota bacterium]
MKFPSSKQETDLISRNKLAVGVDEAGRGPLAGPVVAGAVFIEKEVFEKDFPEKKLIRDSKTLSHNQRSQVFEFIKKNENIFYGIGEVSALTIDRINILNASLLAMRLAVENLAGELFKRGDFSEISNQDKKRKIGLLVDGNKIIPGLPYGQKTFPKGDSSVFSIAAASICAKVYRDNLMEVFNEKFSGYGFNKHKGYGTKEHLLKLQELGPCGIHRKSFGPVKSLVAKNKKT